MRSLILPIVVIGTGIASATSACNRGDQEPSALATRVDDTCRNLARDLDDGASAYERYARTGTTLESVDAAQLPYGSTSRERALSMQRLTEQLVFCRKIPRRGAKGQFDSIEVEESRGANEFVLSDDPRRVATGLRQVANGARRMSEIKIDAR